MYNVCRDDNVKQIIEIRVNILSFVHKSWLNGHIGVHVLYATMPVKKKKSPFHSQKKEKIMKLHVHSVRHLTMG